MHDPVEMCAPYPVTRDNIDIQNASISIFMQSSFEPKLLHTLPLQIADQMADSIVEGRFSPGSRLRETELALSFAVSRATIREALRLLEQRGLVKIQPQRGAHVTQLSAKELDDLFEVRASLLATGSRLAAGRCTEANAKALRDYLGRLRASLGDLTAYAAVSSELVDYLMRMSGNDVLAEYIRDFAQRIGRYVRLGLLARERRKRSLAGWENIVAAVVGGDRQRAEEEHRKLALENRGAALAEFERQSAQPASD
jgi:DNA-binding GntR family transcriptional regulator